MNDNTENVHIYLQNKSQESDILGTASPQEKYIILMNESLQADNKTQASIIKDLEIKLEEMEESSDRLEKGRTYMKGMLKNFHESNKIYVKISECEKVVLDTVKTQSCQAKKDVTIGVRSINVLLLLFLFYCYNFYDFWYFVHECVLVTFLIYMQSHISPSMYTLPLTQVTQTIVEYKQQIKDIMDGQDYLHEFIDDL